MYILDMGVSKNRGTQNGWFIRENHIRINDLGVPLFLDTPIFLGVFIFKILQMRNAVPQSPPSWRNIGIVTCAKSAPFLPWLNTPVRRLPQPIFEGLQAMQPRPVSLYTSCGNTNFEGVVAMKRCPGSDRKLFQTSSLEGFLAMTPHLGSDWSHNQKSSFEGLVAMKRCPGSDRKLHQKSSLEGFPAMTPRLGSD